MFPYDLLGFCSISKKWYFITILHVSSGCLKRDCSHAYLSALTLTAEGALVHYLEPSTTPSFWWDICEANGFSGQWLTLCTLVYLRR